jgi:MFS family permease
LRGDVAVSFLQELRVSWRYLAAAALGFACGNTLNLYIANTFAPHLLHEFGWSKSQFALVGESILVAMIAIPVAGRLTDIVGARRMIAVGVTLTPLLFLGFSRTDGNFSHFFLLNLCHVVVGALTTSVTYSRLIAENFHRSRGVAFAIAASAPPAAGALLTGPLSSFVDLHGWRTGYLLLAAATAVAGAVTFALIPRRRPSASVQQQARGRRTARDYAEILGSPAFRWIAAGMLLCNLTLMVQSSQLKLILLDRGMAPILATSMLSLYASGIIGGRLICGLALDRFPTRIVAALSLGLPSFGLFIFASGVQATLPLSLAVMIVGLSMGAEYDVLAFLVIRYFKVQVYSTVFGLIEPAVSLSAALGSLLLSLMLKVSGDFSAFLYLAAVATFFGSGFFLLLDRPGRAASAQPLQDAP